MAEPRGDYARASAWHTEGPASRRIPNDQRGIADTLPGLGVVQAARGLLDATETLFPESLTLNRALMHLPGMIVALNNQGGVAYYRDDGPRPRALWEESLELSRKHGDVTGAARAINNLGDAARGEGSHQRALTLYREGPALGRVGRNINIILLNLEGMSFALSALGHSRLAARLWGAVETARAEQGLSIMPLDLEAYERETRRLIARLGTEHFVVCLGEGRLMGLDVALPPRIGSVVTPTPTFGRR